MHAQVILDYSPQKSSIAYKELTLINWAVAAALSPRKNNLRTRSLQGMQNIKQWIG